MRSLLLAATVAFAQDRNPFSGDPLAVEAGRETYLGACSACHGASGQGGQGPSLISGREVNRLPDAHLFRSIKNGLPGTDMPNFNLPDDKVWQLVSFVRSLSAPAVTANLQGNPEKGRDLFFGEAGCSKCHMIAGQGGFLGPDLTNAGLNRNVHQLREAVTQPNARVDDGFHAATVITTAGQKLEGIVKNHNNYSVQLLDATGRLHLLQRSSLKSLELRSASLMPADYTKRFSKDRIEDLMTFLSRLSARPYEPEPTTRRRR